MEPGRVERLLRGGRPWHPDGFSSQWSIWVRQQEDVPAVSFHELRHTHASHLIWAGVPIQMVSQRLGRETIQITLDTYGHLLEAHDEEAVERLDQRYRDVTPGDPEE